MLGSTYAALGVSAIVAVVSSAVPVAGADELDRLAGKSFIARGFGRLSPDHPMRPLLCRLNGTRLGVGGARISGRCGSGIHTLRLRLDLRPSNLDAIYELEVRVPAALLLGYQTRYRYEGRKRARGVEFLGTFEFAGIPYRSRFQIEFGAAGIRRIRETVTSRQTGVSTVLVDIKVDTR